MDKSEILQRIYKAYDHGDISANEYIVAELFDQNEASDRGYMLTSIEIFGIVFYCCDYVDGNNTVYYNDNAEDLLRALMNDFSYSDDELEYWEQRGYFEKLEEDSILIREC